MPRSKATEGSILFSLLFRGRRAQLGLQDSPVCQKQGSEEVIEFAAGTLKSMSHLQVMRRMDAHVHISTCLQRIHVEACISNRQHRDMLTAY